MERFQLGEFEEIVLLSVGILNGNAYGVTIRKEIEERLKREVSVGALQTTLRRMEKKGFLKSNHGETSKSRGGRPKLFFIITAVGKNAITYSRETRNELWDALPDAIFEIEMR
jgi:DNA-binding PadR family transcriptional regulator